MRFSKPKPVTPMTEGRSTMTDWDSCPKALLIQSCLIIAIETAKTESQHHSKGGWKGLSISLILCCAIWFLGQSILLEFHHRNGQYIVAHSKNWLQILYALCCNTLLPSHLRYFMPSFYELAVGSIQLCHYWFAPMVSLLPSNTYATHQWCYSYRVVCCYPHPKASVSWALATPIFLVLPFLYYHHP